MKQSFKPLTLAFAVSAALMGGQAFAVNDPTLGVDPSITAAQELMTSSADPRMVYTELGVGVTTQSVYIRIEVSNAVWSSSAPADGDVSITGLGGLTKSLGGAQGTNWAIYEAPTGSGSIGTEVAINLPALASVTGDVGLTYKVFSTLTEANANTVMPLVTKTGTVVEYTPALVFYTSDPGDYSEMALVSTGYKELDDWGVAPAPVGWVEYYMESGVTKPDGAAFTISDLLTAGNMVIGGDFNQGTAFLSPDWDCSTKEGTATVAADKASVTNSLPAINSSDWFYVCYDVDGVNPQPKQQFSVAFDVTPPSNATTADFEPEDIGRIYRDGTVLRVPFMFGGYAGQATYVNLANMGSIPATYTARCFSPTGEAAATGSQKTATIPANTTLKVYMSGLGCGTTANAVEFSFNVQPGSLSGTLVRLNTTTGDSGYSDLTGNQSGMEWY